MPNSTSDEGVALRLGQKPARVGSGLSAAHLDLAQVLQALDPPEGLAPPGRVSRVTWA